MLESINIHLSLWISLCIVFVAFVSCIELPVIPSVSSSASELNVWLSLEQTTVTIGSLNFKTRLFNGSLPGPTLRIRRGDTVRLRLMNNLDKTFCGYTQNAVVTSKIGDAMNTIRDPCITNLHTHGLHVSSEAPADNVFIQVVPDEYYDYIYDIPNTHLGGTHWYHPHHHGSTSGHVGGGASGMIIIEDEVSDGLASEYTNMSEYVIMLTAINTNVADIEAAGGGSWITSAPTAPLLLVNGIVSPTITVTSGSGDTYIRLRFALSATQHSIAIAIPTTCKAMLLAKDGVYLQKGYRATTVIKFAPGNRIDIALTCSIGTHTFTSSPENAVAGNGMPMGGGGDGLASPIEAFPATNVLYIDWQEGGGGAAAPVLSALIYTIPSYLRDLTNIQADETFDKGVTVQGGNGCTFACGPYEHDTVLQYMSVNKIQEFDVAANNHPFHMHINHMQLTTVDNGGDWDGWHQEGDFMDTFLGSGTVRFITDVFTGEVIIHCHLLTHEDLGCMTQMVIVEDKNNQPWGYCLHGDVIPGIIAITLSIVSALLTCSLAVMYSGKMQQLYPNKYCSPEGVICGMERQHFGQHASGAVSILFIVSIFPLIYDDGYNGGLVTWFHANEASYMAFLPLHIIFSLVTLILGVWLFWSSWFRGKNAAFTFEKDAESSSSNIDSGSISMVQVAPDESTADANDAVAVAGYQDTGY